MSRRAIKWLVIVGVTAAVAGGAAVGVYYYLRWHHERQIEGRLSNLDQIISNYAKKYAIPADILREMIRQESGGDELAVSDHRAKGLMQVTEDAAKDVRQRHRDIGDGNLFDPDYNIQVGTAYLREMLDRFNGDAYLALAAYNWGPANVQRVRLGYHGQNVSGRQIVEANAPEATKRYCQKILQGKELQIARIPRTR